MLLCLRHVEQICSANTQVEAETETEAGSVGDLELPNIGGEGGYFDHDEVRGAAANRLTTNLWESCADHMSRVSDFRELPRAH